MIDAQFAGYTPEQMYNLLEYTPEKATPEQVRAIGQCLRETEEDHRQVEYEGWQENEELRNRVDNLESLSDELANSLDAVLAAFNKGELDKGYEIDDAQQTLKEYRDWIANDHTN